MLKLITFKMLWVIVLVYIGYGAYLFFAQSSIIYYPNFPTKSDFNNCPAFSDAEKVDMNGTRAYYKHVGEKIAVVYHGNAGSACDRDYLKNVFKDAGYSYLFVEYAGYGGDNKNPSRELIFKDVENVVAFLQEKNYKEVSIITESIGAGAASHHASLLPPDNMLFIAPFDSLANVARSHFPFFLYPKVIMEKFSKENYDNVPLLQKYEGGLTIVHGTKDRIIPIKHGKALFEKVSTQDKQFIEVDGAGHNNIYGFKELWNVISSFLSKMI